MAIKDEIEKPIINLVFVESGTLSPTHIIFNVTVNFKPVNGVVPYPPLTYQSERNDAGSARIKKNDLLSKIFDRVRKHKNVHDFLKSQQNELDLFLTQEWGA